MLKYRNLYGAVLTMFLVVALSAACLSAKQRAIIRVTASPVSSPLAERPVGAIGPENFPAQHNPLTGFPVDDLAVLNRRPLAIKISNAPAEVRPQAGIGAADLVFEHYVEGSLTRFTAIFWTHTPPRVGSIRSARLIDLELPAMYAALFAYSGASDPIRQRIAELPFAARAYEGVTINAPLYYRDPSIAVPHNLFVIPAALWERATAEQINTPPENFGGMAFAPTPPPHGIAAGQVTIDYGPDTVMWQYDVETTSYHRTVNGTPHHDANTGEPVTAVNVVVLYAQHQDDLDVVESEWQGNKEYSTEIQLWGSGPATLIRDGQMFQGVWVRKETNDMLSFWTNEDMTQRLYLKPGNTWFQVVPLDFTKVWIS